MHVNDTHWCAPVLLLLLLTRMRMVVSVHSGGHGVILGRAKQLIQMVIHHQYATDAMKRQRHALARVWQAEQGCGVPVKEATG
eukprot:30506-Eustigmatos_ZCMA.PRE.1